MSTHIRNSILMIVLSVMVIGCGTSTSVVSLRSERDLANVLNASTGKTVRVQYVDSTAAEPIEEWATDLIITVDSASWLGRYGRQRTIASRQLKQVRCVECINHTAAGVGTGIVIGSLVGAVVGGIINFANQPLWAGYSSKPPDSNAVPPSIAVGVILGGVIGAPIGSSIDSDEVWTFVPR